MDYLVADATVIPPGAESHYREQVVRLPYCYLSADIPPVSNQSTRVQAGLPDTAFVLCAFTHPYKIRPPVFDAWMSVLRQMPDAILWLREMGTAAHASLQSEALKRGVDPARLLFAPHLPSTAEHLSRQSLADLYLDTLPYNAYSTALDALGAGVPVLTCTGGSFASRVAASALAVVGLPELITYDLKEYEHKALELGRNPQKRTELRDHLLKHHKSSPLFDTARHCRYLEAAFARMHERSLKGDNPAGFSVTL
jgi:predicted O-linked N-acetylglucosamine transferase (SPINDLY family)